MALGSGNIEIDVSARVDTQGIVRQVNDAQRQINRNPVNLTLNEKGFTQPLGRISGDIAEFQKSLDASVARTLAFGAAVGVLNSVANGFKAMVKDAVEVEKTLADINVILNLSSNSLLKFSDDLFQVAKNTGQTFQSVSEAAIELSRQGLGAEETLKRINDAMILTRLSGMEAAKSVETLTAAVNSFGSTALTTTELVNKLATVDAAFAVSTEDLANALARAGSTAQGAKVSLDELLASVTSVQQITARGGSVIGNAFKSIFTRIQRAGVREALEEIGVATTDAAGNIRGALDIIKDYAGVYSTLTDAQRAYTDELVAGVFQINNFKALVKDLSSDYSIYERALKQSNGATDEAVRRNEQLQSTLASLINESAANVKQLSAALGDLVATPAIENLLTIFNKLSGALAGALEGEGIIKNIFEGIGKFISGPGLVLISVAFIKLFKFITGQAGGALKAVFNIGAAKDRIADAESKIGLLLQGNKALYEAITNEALDNQQKQELVLNTIKAQNQAYQQQQTLISNIARSSAVQTSLSGVNAASGYVPNFANGVEGAIVSEKEAIRAGTGGVSKSARPKVLKNFPIGGGKKETIVANTDEVIVPNYGGGQGSAIFNKDMIKKSGGVPQGAIPVSRGFVPNFIKGKKRGGAGPNATSKIGFLGTEAYKRAGNFFDGEKPNLDFERVVGGIGIISAKGKSGSITKSEIQNPTSGNFLGASGTRDIVDQIGGSKLNDAEKSELVKRLGRKGKVRFSNIGSASLSGLEDGQTANQLAGRAGSINDIIGPYIANATAAVAQKIYGNLFGDEVKAQDLIGSVFNAATTQIDKIATVSTEGSILEAAIRLGSQQSAANFGGDAEATWDFEESSPISPDLKSLFFDPIGYGNIRRADAKRIGSDAAVTEVVKKAYDTPEMLERLKAFHSQQFRPLVEGAIAGKQQKNAAGGFVPNFSKRGAKRKDSPEKVEAWAQRAKKENSQNKEYQNSERMAEQYGMRHSFFVNYLAGQKKLPADFFEPASQKKALKFKNDFLDLSVNNKYKNAAKLTERLAKEDKNLSGKKLSKYILGETTLKNPQFISQAVSPNTDTSKKVRRILGEKKFNSFIENINKIKKDSSYNETMALHFEAGHKFEEALSILGGVTPEKNPDALDFSRTKGRKLGFDSDIAKTMGLDNRKGYGDAHKGRGHGSSKMEGKIIRELDEANTLYRILGFAGEGDMSLYSKANLKSHPFPDIVAKGRDGIKTSSRTFGSLYNKNKKAFDKLVQKKYGKPYSQLQKREKAKLDKRNINFTYAIDDVDFGKIDLHGNKKGMKAVRSFLDMEKEIQSNARGLIPNFSLFAEPLPGDSGRSNQLDHFEKNSYGAYDSTLNIRSFFPKSGSLAIGNLFKDVISMADSGNPYTKIEAGEVVGPRIPKMLVMAKKLLDRKRAAGLNQPPMSIEGFMEPFGLLATMGRNKRWYEAEKQIAESKGGKFKPSNPGTGINKAPLSAKYVPAEEKTLLDSLRQLGLTVDERDSSGGFKEFDRYYLKNLPLFKGGFAGGYIPNFPALQGMGEHSGVYDVKGKSGARSLNIAYLSSVGSSGPQIFKNLLQQLTGAAEEGNPYTEVNAGEIVGPRIPTVILKAKKILDRQRASGKNIPFMNVRGVMDPPARLLEKLKMHKLGLSGKTSSVYVKGEEKQLLQSFKELGLNPESWEMRDLNTIPMLKNFASGHIPNFVNALEESIAREKEALNAQGSNAKIYVDKDDRVKGPNNPMGLLVANTRDEPRDGSQGVNRAIANNIDPKRSGSARGIIPNFIAGAGISGDAASQKMQMAAELSSKFSGVDSTVDSFSGLVAELEELDDQTKENKKLLQDLVLTFKDLYASGEASIEQLSGLGTLIDAQLSNAEDYQTEVKGGSSNQESIDFERNFQKQENEDARDFLKDEGIELQDSDLSEVREKWIKEYNALVDTITTGAKDLDLPDEELAKEFEKLNKVKNKLTKSGVNIEKALSMEKLKTVDIGDRSKGLSPKLSSGAQDLLKTSDKAASALKKQAKAQDKLGRSSGDAMAKIFGIQFALSQLSALTDFDTTGFQSTVGIIQGIESVAPQAFDKIGDAIGGLVGKAGPYGQILQAGIVAAGLGYDVYRQFFDAEQLAIKELEKEIETRKDAIDVISKNIEKVDQFATSAAKFGESVKAGDMEATGKFMQQIFDSAQDVASLDPKTFENVIASLGDAEKLNKSIGEFKEAAEASRALKQSEQDIANIFKEITTQVDDAQFLGIDFSDGVKAIDALDDAIGILPPQAYLYKAAFEKFNKDIAIDYSQFAEQFQQIGRSLAQKVSSENLRPLAESLNGLSINSSNAYNVISSLSPAIGELDEATKKKLATDGRVASEVLKQLNVQIQYKAAVQKAKEAFDQSVKPINKLDDNLNKLAKALSVAADASQDALKTFEEIGKIEAAGRVGSLEARSTIGQSALASGTANANIENSLRNAAREQSNALQKFASNILQVEKEGVVELSGSIKNTLSAIQSGSVSNEKGLKLLLDIQKNGTTEEKDIAEKTIEELRKINSSQINSAKIIEANLKAQIKKQQDQAVSFQRNTTISEGQLDALDSLRQDINRSQSSQEIIQQIAKQNEALKLLADAGADEEIINSIKEGNKQLNQLSLLKALAQGTTGEGFESRSLGALEEEINSFIKSDSFNQLAEAAKTGTRGVLSAVQTAMESIKDAGVKGEGDVEEAALVTFDQAAVNSLTSEMAKAVSDGLASALGIGPELAKSINEAVDVDVVARSIEKMASENAKNAISNAEATRKLNEGMLEAMRAADFGQLANSSSSLERAADRLNEAADKIIANSAGGFVPNFAPNPASRALSTESKMGAKRPILDSHPSIGTYVRDGATQPNFAAVKRDHPEGLKQATKNSRAIQSTNSKGFVPNYFSLPDIIGDRARPNSWFAKMWKDFGVDERQEITNRPDRPIDWFENAAYGHSYSPASFAGNWTSLLAEGADNTASVLTQGLRDMTGYSVHEMLSFGDGDLVKFMAAANATPQTLSPIDNVSKAIQEYSEKAKSGEVSSGLQSAVENYFKEFKVGPKGTIQAGTLFKAGSDPTTDVKALQNKEIDKIFDSYIWRTGENLPIDEFTGRYSRTGEHFPPQVPRQDVLVLFQKWMSEKFAKNPASLSDLQELIYEPAGSTYMRGRMLEWILESGGFQFRFLKSTGGIDKKGIKTEPVLNDGIDSRTEASDEQKDFARKALLLGAFNKGGSSKGSESLPRDELIKYGGSKGLKLVEQNRQTELVEKALSEIHDRPIIPWSANYLMNEDEQVQFDFTNTPTQYKSIKQFEDDLKIIDIIEPLINENIRRYKKGGDLENAEKLKDSHENLFKINDARKSAEGISEYFGLSSMGFSDFYKNPFYLDQKTGKTKYENGKNLDSLYIGGNQGQFETDGNPLMEGLEPKSSGSLGERYKETVDQLFSKPSGKPLYALNKFLDSELYSPDLAQLATNIHPEATAELTKAQLAEAVARLKAMKETAGWADPKEEEIKAQEKIIKGIQEDKIVADTGVEEFLKDKKEKIEIQKEKKATATEEERARLYTALLGGRAGEERADFLGSDPVAAFNERREKAIGVMGRYVQSGGVLDLLKKQRERRLASLQGNRSTTVQENIPKVQEELDFINSRISLYSNGNEEGIAHLFGIDDDKRYSLVNGKPIHSRVLDANPAKIDEYNALKSQIEKIQQVTEAEGAMGGEERGGILNKYERNIARNKEKLLAFAGIQPHIGNSGGPQSGEWIERFKQGTGDDRKKLMSKLGLFEETFESDPNELESDALLDNLRSITDPYSAFYLGELQKADGKNDAYLKLVKKITHDIVQNEGIPYFPTDKIGDVLKGEKLDFLTPGGQVPESINAVDSEYVSSLVRNIANIQTEAINEKTAKNGGDPDRLLGEILSARKFGDLENNLHYLNYQIQKGKGGAVKAKINKLLNDPSKVENYSDWQTFYGKSAPAVIGGLTSNTNYGIPPKWADAIKNAQEIDPEFFGIAGNNNATPFDAAQKVIQGITHGTNTGIQGLLSENNDYPFPNLHPDKDASGKKFFEDWLYAHVKMATDDPTFSAYAPFGYTKKWKTSAPMANINALTQFKELINPILNGVKAKGFIPNFSKIAGEIAASKTAGYKTPVTASQVKSINIPGAGKSTYNTQESVFKARGMSQPFIAPPSNSKAAKPYAKQVQRKFNFNPYGKKSADGFVPNFAPNGSGADFSQMQESVRLFDEATLAFASTVSNFDQIKEASQIIFNGADLFSKQSEALRSSASSFQESADKISQLENQEPIKFEPLTAAVSKIEISFDKLSTNLNKPLEINSSSIVTSMDNLASAVSTMQAKMAVSIADVNVNINGAAQITDSIRSLLQAQIPQMVQSEISKMKLATKSDIGMV